MRTKTKPKPRYPARKTYRASCRWCALPVTGTTTGGRGVFECPHCGATFEMSPGRFTIAKPGRGKRRWE